MYATKPVKPAPLAASTAAPATWRPPLDGLDTVSAAPVEVEIPGRLRSALLDLRLLKGVPLAYLVPDPELLPPESIRLFHVDPTWTDRLVDGALSAGRVGSLDVGFSGAALAGLRRHLDEALEERASLAFTRLILLERGEEASLANLVEKRQTYTWPGRASGGPPPLTGMLIRSELVTRWPDMLIRGFSASSEGQADAAHAVPLLRRERLSDDLLIVLFAGVPERVEIEEPPTGIRFGVEGNSPPYSLTERDVNESPVTLPIPLQPEARRTLSLDEAALDAALGSGKRSRNPARTSTWFAWWFLQPPYIQVFSSAAPEAEGSKAEAPPTVTVRRRAARFKPYFER